MTSIRRILGEGKQHHQESERYSCFGRSEAQYKKATAMNNSSNSTGENLPSYSPQTSEERNAASRLLSELEKESARQQAFREALVQQLSGLDPPVAGPRLDNSREAQEKFHRAWGKFMGYLPKE